VTDGLEAPLTLFDHLVQGPLSSAVLSEISDGWETDRVSLNMKAS
jgi:hypothetical protein